MSSSMSEPFQLGLVIQSDDVWKKKNLNLVLISCKFNTDFHNEGQKKNLHASLNFKKKCKFDTNVMLISSVSNVKNAILF